jgi:hypothetical protein
VLCLGVILCLGVELCLGVVLRLARAVLNLDCTQLGLVRAELGLVCTELGLVTLALGAVGTRLCLTGGLLDAVGGRAAHDWHPPRSARSILKVRCLRYRGASEKYCGNTRANKGRIAGKQAQMMPTFTSTADKVA